MGLQWQGCCGLLLMEVLQSCMICWVLMLVCSMLGCG
jgi:hypothetical protein